MGGDDHDPSGNIGLLQAVSIGVGGMVGGGIFAVLGVAATQAGGATPLAFALGGAIAALTAISYARLSRAHPSGGGTVDIIDRSFGIGTVTGAINIVLWAGYIATLALYTSAFANYATALVTGGAPGPVGFRLLALAGIAVPWMINLTNAGLVAKTEGAVVAVKTAILMVVIVAGAPGASGSALAPSQWPGAGSILASAMLVFVAYEGFELIANAADDIRDPGHTLPLAFALSVGVVVVLYMAIAAVVVGSLSAAQISRAQDFALAEAASGSLGRAGFTMVAVSAVLATFSAINATLYGSARLSYSIASEGQLPAQLETRTWNQPIGLHLTAAASLALALSLGLSSISAVASSIFLIVFCAVNVAGATRPGPPTSRGLSALGAVGCLVSLVVLLARTARDDRAAIVSLVILGAVAVVAERIWLNHGRTGSRAP